MPKRQWYRWDIVIIAPFLLLCTADFFVVEEDLMCRIPGLACIVFPIIDNVILRKSKGLAGP